jgi:hypothetical protein
MQEFAAEMAAAEEEMQAEALRAEAAEAALVVAQRELDHARAKAAELGDLETRYWHDFNDLHLQLRAHLDERDALLRKVSLPALNMHACTPMHTPHQSPQGPGADPVDVWLRTSAALRPSLFYNAVLSECHCGMRELSAACAQIDRITNHLDRLRRTNVYNDAFHIWFEGPFATISGFRMGRTAACPVEWDEINAAWGQAVLLLHTLAQVRALPVRGLSGLSPGIRN